MGPGDHQRAQLNGAIATLLEIAATGDDLLAAPLRITLAYLDVLETGSPTLAIRHRGATTVHVTDPAQVARTASYDRDRGQHDADGVAGALAHLLAGDPNGADNIVTDLEPADLAAVATAARRLGELVDARVWHLLRLRRIGPGAR